MSLQDEHRSHIKFSLVTELLNVGPLRLTNYAIIVQVVVGLLTTFWSTPIILGNDQLSTLLLSVLNFSGALNLYLAEILTPLSSSSLQNVSQDVES
jgi:hypothetical protein